MMLFSVDGSCTRTGYRKSEPQPCTGNADRAGRTRTTVTTFTNELLQLLANFHDGRSGCNNDIPGDEDRCHFIPLFLGSVLGVVGQDETHWHFSV